MAAGKLGWRPHTKDVITYSSRELRLVAALQTAQTFAIQGRNRHDGVKVVDFGGGPGTHYSLVQSMPNFDVTQYTIVESPAVATALQEFSDEIVSWMHVSDENPLKGLGTVDIVLSSSALQYVENPFGVLREFATMAPTVILDRLPLVDCPSHFLAKQNTRYESRGVSFPAWIFSESAFLAELHNIGYQVIYRWEVPEDRPFLMGRRWSNQGMLLRTNIIEV
jgi:putative methyltransferase (TIGR04325 family)